MSRMFLREQIKEADGYNDTYITLSKGLFHKMLLSASTLPERKNVDQVLEDMCGCNWITSVKTKLTVFPCLFKVGLFTLTKADAQSLLIDTFLFDQFWYFDKE